MGYTITRCDRTGPPRSKTPRGGGVAILTGEHLRTTKLAIGGADPAVESLWLSVTGAGRRTVVVGAIYRPPGTSTPRGLELIEEQLRAAVATGKPVIALGDFNFNPRPAGPLNFPPPAGGGGGCLNTPPSISAPAHRRTKRKTAFESSRKIISKSFRSFFGSGQN